MRFETRAVHDGQEPDKLTGSVTVPVYQTSTFLQDGVGKHKGYEYSRTGNPTRRALEVAMASLEGGGYSLAFASGVAATAAVFSLLENGEHIVCAGDVYGGTYRLIENVVKKWGVKASYARADDADSFEEALTDRTRMIWIETPTNPLLKIIDIKKIAEIARADNILLAVDNTFASPYLQNPLALGADIVVHSTTKYIAGHSDIVGGAVVMNDKKVYSELKSYQNSAGAVPGPWDCWLVLRGLKTLPVRMRAHQDNALYLAGFLSAHQKVERVYYPGLETDKYHAAAKKQMLGPGGMLAFELKGGKKAVPAFFAGLEIFILAESLGGVESLISYPAGMTHASVPERKRLELGITDSLIRVSAGIENKNDLKDDIANALESL